MNMEFLTRNIVNTTTMISVNSGSTTVSYMFDRKSGTKFIAPLTATVTCNFSLSSESVSRIILEGINFKNFSITYNTGNAIALLNADTSSSSWTGNSATNLYLYFNTITVNTLTVNITSITASGDKEITELWVCDKIHTLERNPSSDNYNVSKDRKEFIHNLSDGGSTQYVLNNYFQAVMKLDYISYTETTYFKEIFDLSDAFVFVPFPTGTGWTNRIYETIWSGDYNFDQRAHNDESVGYIGSIKLLETGK